jgi:hypothetical protein
MENPQVYTPAATAVLTSRVVVITTVLPLCPPLLISRSRARLIVVILPRPHPYLRPHPLGAPCRPRGSLWVRPVAVAFALFPVALVPVTSDAALSKCDSIYGKPTGTGDISWSGGLVHPRERCQQAAAQNQAGAASNRIDRIHEKRAAPLYLLRSV